MGVGAAATAVAIAGVSLAQVLAARRFGRLAWTLAALGIAAWPGTALLAGSHAEP